MKKNCLSGQYYAKSLLFIEIDMLNRLEIEFPIRKCYLLHQIQTIIFPYSCYKSQILYIYVIYVGKNGQNIRNCHILVNFLTISEKIDLYYFYYSLVS